MRGGPVNLRRELPGLTPAQRAQVARSMCSDGSCGGIDCYRCRGTTALDSLEERFPELFSEEDSEA